MVYKFTSILQKAIFIIRPLALFIKLAAEVGNKGGTHTNYSPNAFCQWPIVLYYTLLNNGSLA